MDKKKLFLMLKAGKLLGPSLDTSEVAGVEAIVDEATARKWPIAWTSYALATAYHETAHSMKPIKELGGPKYLTRMYDVTGSRPDLARRNGNTTPGDGIKYCGRGFVQLTWKNNYARAEKELDIVGLTNNPDLAMNLLNATKILGSGMEEGWFSGVSLKKCIPTDKQATVAIFISSRRIINGTDKADLIASYAIEFQRILSQI